MLVTGVTVAEMLLTYQRFLTGALNKIIYEPALSGYFY